MKLWKAVPLALALGILLALAGCNGDEGPAERAGEKIDQAVEEAGDKLEETTDEVGGKLEEAGDKLEQKSD